MGELRLENAARTREMPLLSAMAAHWRESGIAEETFPRLQEFKPTWWAPFCFRCGWIAPTKKAEDYPDNWDDDRVFSLTWEAAAGWLERAHLRDHKQGGDESLENLVPLCILCHDEQPICRSVEEGVEFVRSLSRRWRIQPWLQVATDVRYGSSDLRNPGKGKALRCLLRAQGDVAIFLAEAAEKTLEEVG